MNTLCKGLLGIVVMAAWAGLARAQQAEATSDAQIKAIEGAHAPEGHGGAHGHEEHIGAKGANMQPEEFKQDLAIFTFIVFLLLLAILGKFAWTPIMAGLEKREQRIADHAASAERAHEDAKTLLAQYEKKLASSADEVRAIIDEARRDAEHTQQEILAKARADAQSERDRALREIETAKDQALKELGERTANLAVDLAGKIVRAQLNTNDHRRLIEDALARFPSAN